MIICVTPNVAVDRTYVMPTVRLGTVLRSNRTVVTAGGKGLNVARAITVLGGQSLVMGILGGRSGDLVAELADAEGLAAHWSWVAGETRNCAILVAEDGAPETVINDRGGKITMTEWLQFIQDVGELAQGNPVEVIRKRSNLAQTENTSDIATPRSRSQSAESLDGRRADAVCICGSLPPGTPPHAPADLVETLLATNTPVWVDASGPALAHALDACPTGVKINREEAGGLLGRNLTYLDDIHDAARHLQHRGIDYVVITLGSRGAVLHGPDGEYHLRTPPVQAMSAMGSGDAFLGALLVALTRGLSAKTALAWGVAAGAANTLSPGGGFFARADFDELLAELL